MARIESDRQYSITQTQAERFAWALERLQRDEQDIEDSLLTEVCKDAIRSQLGDLRTELREYETRKAREAEFDALAADIPETITDEDLPQPRILTEEESRQMKENPRPERLRHEPRRIHEGLAGRRIRW